MIEGVKEHNDNELFLVLPFGPVVFEQQDFHQHRTVVIEVKTRPVSLGDAIRQIKLYQAHGRADIWVFATTIPLDISYRDALENEGIRTLLINDEYKNVQQIKAEMDTL